MTTLDVRLTQITADGHPYWLATCDQHPAWRLKAATFEEIRDRAPSQAKRHHSRLLQVRIHGWDGHV